MNAHAADEAAAADADQAQGARKRRKRKRHARLGRSPGRVDRGDSEGEDGRRAQRARRLPVLLSRRCVTTARATIRRAGAYPRIYKIRDEHGQARTRPTGWSSTPAIVGEYYGVQGMTWKQPADPRRARATRARQRPQLLAVLRRRAPAPRRLAHASRPSTGSPTRSRRRSPTTQMLAIAASLRRLGAPTAPQPLASLRRLMSANARTDRRHRHRLRRPGHGGRLRRAGQRGLLRRHRRRQDRAPAARARSRSTSPGWRSCVARNRERLHFSHRPGAGARARAAAVRGRRHAADLLGRRRPLRGARGGRRDAAVRPSTRW